MLVPKPVILCVDDEPINLLILERVLTSQGYEVIKAKDGREALEIIHQQKIDLILLDVMMPEVNGFEVCAQLKRNDRFRDTPVVMLTALESKESRIKGIEAGAEDFICKPFDQSEVMARIKMLLKMRDLNNSRISAYNHITRLTSLGERMVRGFDPLHFNFSVRIEGIIGQLVRQHADMSDNPQVVLMGFEGEKDGWQWDQYQYQGGKLGRKRLQHNLQNFLPLPGKGKSSMVFLNNADLSASEFLHFTNQMAKFEIALDNMVCYLSDVFCIFAFNYGRTVNQYDASVLNSLVMEGLFLKSISSQIKEVEEAFGYTVEALARASEVNDDDTGNHIVRVGVYGGILAEQLGMPETFVKDIRMMAPMHDIGKIHTPSEVLRKPGKLTPEEWEIMKSHTVCGAKILGNHHRLAMAKNIALTHHERWDGSGYPAGMRGEEIPLEGRITNLADQYDALRNPRVYKPAFDHQTSFKIIAEGDGRTLPQHFDPQVLQAFKEVAAKFEETYETTP